MITPGGNRYEVVLADKHYLRELVESITLEDSLDEIALRATIRLAATDDFQSIGISPGQEIRVSGIPFGGTGMVYLLHPGVVWDCSSSSRIQKHINVTIYDRTIFISRSEDEYLFPAGQTASQRLKKYAADWGIKLLSVPDTGVPLAKEVYRARSIYSMIQEDLRHTVSGGGDMYRPRMTPDGLELYKLGSNQEVWALETDQNVEEITQHRTLDGAVTRVKVLGNASGEGRSPVLAVETGETGKYGTLQRVLSDSSITDAGTARKKAREMLAGEDETVSITCLDINTVRAGDRLVLNGNEWLVTSVRHELGLPGRMFLELAPEEVVRRRYYG
ncbi:MAG: phage portal protein [Peptococcaceae bacterium BICA1-7]|nr:MAG: phage portal protein [Peptococcaceae bacterium BICA1-7]HBV95634.1 phage portal protein [Desulfotomaculum sp.]